MQKSKLIVFLFFIFVKRPKLTVLFFFFAIIPLYIYKRYYTNIKICYLGKYPFFHLSCFFLELYKWLNFGLFKIDVLILKFCSTIACILVEIPCIKFDWSSIKKKKPTYIKFDWSSIKKKKPTYTGECSSAYTKWKIKLLNKLLKRRKKNWKTPLTSYN